MIRPTRLILPAASLILLVVALELVSRWVLGSARGEELRQRAATVPEAHWENHPFLPFVGIRSETYRSYRQVNGSEFEIEVQNNAFGFRTHEFTRKDSDFVVVCLGDSTTWGEAARTNKSTWPEMLESLLGQRLAGRRVRVFNLGVPVTSSAYGLVAFALYGARLSPDIVIVYPGRNELSLLARSDPLPDYSHAVRDLGVIRQPWINRLPAWMRSSTLALWVAEKLGAESLSEKVVESHGTSDLLYLISRSVLSGDASGALDSRRMSLFEEHLEAIEDLAAARGGLTIFSTSQFRDPDAIRDEFNEQLRDWYRREKKIWVDVEAAIKDHRSDLQFDDVHLTEMGRQQVARLFFEKIEGLGLLDAAR